MCNTFVATVHSRLLPSASRSCSSRCMGMSQATTIVDSQSWRTIGCHADAADCTASATCTVVWTVANHDILGSSEYLVPLPPGAVRVIPEDYHSASSCCSHQVPIVSVSLTPVSRLLPVQRDLSSNKLYGQLPAALGQFTGLVFLDIHDNGFTGSPISSFLSPLIGNTTLGTYDFSKNFFTALPANFTSGQGGGSSFCPWRLQGRWGSVNGMGDYGSNPSSSGKANCFLGSAWNVSESYSDGGGGRSSTDRGKSLVGGSGKLAASLNDSSNATCALGEVREAQASHAMHRLGPEWCFKAVMLISGWDVDVWWLLFRLTCSILC